MKDIKYWIDMVKRSSELTELEHVRYLLNAPRCEVRFHASKRYQCHRFPIHGGVSLQELMEENMPCEYPIISSMLRR